MSLFFQAKVSPCLSMCWLRPLRSPPYTEPSRWLWTDHGCRDVSTHQAEWCEGVLSQAFIQTYFLLLLLCFYRTKTEGGEVRRIQALWQRLQHHCIIRYCIRINKSGGNKGMFQTFIIIHFMMYQLLQYYMTLDSMINNNALYCMFAFRM